MYPKNVCTCLLVAFALVHEEVDSLSLPHTPVNQKTGTKVENGVDCIIQEHIKRVTEQHQYEFENGVKIFGMSNILTSDECHHDDDFVEYQVKVGHGGPSEKKLKNGNKIFETKSQLLNDDDCDFLIRMARETIKNERESVVNEHPQNPLEQKPQWQTTNSEIGEARLSNLPPRALEMIRCLLNEKIYPMLQSSFRVENLTVYDGLIIGSIAPSISQPVHRDASLLTINFALSSPESYEGGGTYVEGLENHSGEPLRVSRGKALCHSSGIMHAGTAISQGERWVMVLFVISRNEVEVPRRCHAEGLNHVHAKRWDDANLSFETGLSEAPKDHLLHMGIGQVASLLGREQESLDCLFKAAQCYPEAHKASMTIAKILESKGKPRAALRRYELVLSNINHRDLPERAWMPLKALAWDARVSAARCTLLCAEYEAHNKYKKVSQESRSWTKAHLPTAIDWLQQALIPAPNHDYLHSMLNRAVEIIEEIHEIDSNVRM